jgi:guanylate kinase
MPKLFVITGPSGSGKTSVALELLRLYPSLKKLVTCTTRPPRPGETDGVDYNFLTADQFAAGVAAGDFFEWAKVYEHSYGNRTRDLEKLLVENFDVLMVVDIQGAQTIKHKRPEAELICILPASTDELLSRLQKRDQGQTVNLAARRAAAEAETAFCQAQAHCVLNPEGQLPTAVSAAAKIMGYS